MKLEKYRLQRAIIGRPELAAALPEPGQMTNMTAAFSTVSDPTGTWTLRLEDGCAGDSGSISAATLTVDGSMTPAAQQHVVDFDGNGKTDFALVRNIGGGPRRTNSLVYRI